MPSQEDLKAFFLKDQLVRGLRSGLDAASRLRDRQKRQLELLTRQRDELQSQFKQEQVAAGTLENELSALDEKITKLREQMNSVRSDKEYAALLVEVNTLKADKAKVEERLLEQMSRVESLTQEIEVLASRVSEQEKVLDVAQRQVDERSAEVGARLAEAEAGRQEAASRLPADVLSVYERLSDAYDGEALAEVVPESPKHMEYTCGGCYMQIPVERLNTILVRADELTTCPSCGRYLYAEQALRESVAPRDK
jgi:hypothetical protein